MSDLTIPFNVLFLGHTNTARSIMAEAILNREGRGKFYAWSAGIVCGETLDAQTADLLKRMQFDVSRLYPKGWTEFTGTDALEFDFVFTLCERATLLPHSSWSGHPMVAHWSVPDPALAQGNAAQIRLAYAEAFRMLRSRIDAFVSLPLRSLDRLTMQRHLDRIGDQADLRTDIVAA